MAKYFFIGGICSIIFGVALLLYAYMPKTFDAHKSTGESEIASSMKSVNSRDESPPSTRPDREPEAGKDKSKRAVQFEHAEAKAQRMALETAAEAARQTLAAQGQMEPLGMENVAASNPSPVESREKLSRDLVEQIRNDSSHTQQLSEQVKIVMKELADKGGDMISLLAEEFQKPPGGEGNFASRNTIIINALKAIGSEEAKTALLNMALEDIPQISIIETRAAEAFIALAKDSSEIAQLLSSAEPAVRDVAGGELAGKPLTSEAIAALIAFQESNSKFWRAHDLVASAFGRDPLPDKAAEKIDILFKALLQLEQLPDEGPVWVEAGITGPEAALGSYITAMSSMPGADDVLRRRLESADGLQWTMIVIALANRGDEEVHDKLLQIIKTTTDGNIRTMAVTGLYHIGTKDDIPLLQELAKSDPYTRHGMLPKGETSHSMGTIHPVRYAAERVLSKLESR